MCPTCNQSATETGGLGQTGADMYGTRNLGGKVTMENKQRIPYPVEVRVVCGDAIKRSTRTDGGGNYTIDPNDPNDLASAAQKSHPQDALARLTGCTVEAVLPGFKSDRVAIGSQSLTGNRSINTIVLHPESGQTSLVVSKTSDSAPKDARKAFEKAHLELDANKVDLAEKDLKKAVALYPAYAEAWRELAAIQESKSAGDAMNSYKQAIAADPQFVPAYIGMANLANREEKWTEALDYGQQTLKLAPRGFPDAWYYVAAANYRLGHRDIAEKDAITGLAEDPGHRLPELEQLLGVILYDKRNYTGALEHMQNALKWMPKDSDTTLLKAEISTVEKAVSMAKK